MILQLKLPKALFMLVFGVIAVTLITPVMAAKSKSLDITTVKAPVAPDGTTAGAVTDFIINFKNLHVMS